MQYKRRRRFIEKMNALKFAARQLESRLPRGGFVTDRKTNRLSVLSGASIAVRCRCRDT